MINLTITLPGRALALCACCAIGVACGSSTNAPRRRLPLSHVAYVMDRSASLQGKQGTGCSSVRAFILAALTERDPFRKGQALEGVGFDEYQKDPVVVQLWGTADTKQPGSPWLMGERTFEPERGMEDRSAKLARIEAASRSIGTDLENICNQSTQNKQDKSPIYSILSEVVGALHNNCPATRECILVVQSDLVETQEPGLTRAVDAIRKGRTNPSTPSALPPPIDLGGAITVFVCGYGVSTDVVGEPQRLQIVQLWKDKLLANPKRWIQQAQCPVPTDDPPNGR